MKMLVQGLPDVKGGVIDMDVVSSSTQNAIADVLDHLAVSRGILFACDNGCICIYSNDAGKYHCRFDRHLTTRADALFSNKNQVRAWLNTWLPETGWRAA